MYFQRSIFTTKSFKNEEDNGTVMENFTAYDTEFFQAEHQ